MRPFPMNRTPLERQLPKPAQAATDHRLPAATGPASTIPAAKPPAANAKPATGS